MTEETSEVAAQENLETENTESTKEGSAETSRDAAGESGTEESSTEETTGTDTAADSGNSTEKTEKTEAKAETQNIVYNYETVEKDTAKVSTANTAGMDFSFSETETEKVTTKKEEKADEPKIPSVPASGMIIEGGTYILSGTVTDKTITVNATGAEINIILKNANVHNSGGPAIYVRAASKVTLTLAEGTSNSLSDGSSYSITDGGSKLDGAIFSKADLTIEGTGTLNVNGNFKHGIVSKDDLVITSGRINVISKNIGINGKDCVKINSGNITVVAGTSGITSDNNTDASKGFVYLLGGFLNVTSGSDGIAAQTVINAENVNLTVRSGGGSSSASNLAGSFKGLKAGSDIYVKGGTFVIDSKDDSIHSNGTVTISGGTYTLSTSDDGIHADTDLGVSGASTRLTVEKCLEGIEASDIVIAGGKVKITATENGLDANGSLSLLGGELSVNISGGKDSTVFKFDSTGILNGGIFVGTGVNGKQQKFETSSTQGVITLSTETEYSESTVTVCDPEGNVIISATAENNFSYVVISCPAIRKGETYTVSIGSYFENVTAQ